MQLALRCDFFVLCRAVNTSDAACLITSPQFPVYRRAVQLLYCALNCVSPPLICSWHLLCNDANLSKRHCGGPGPGIENTSYLQQTSISFTQLFRLHNSRASVRADSLLLLASKTSLRILYSDLRYRLLNRLYFKTSYRFLETGLKPVNRYDVIA